MAKRKNNTYKYEKGKTFKISRSGIDSFIKCPRCFYINKVLNIKDIGGPGFSLNSAVDELLKKEFDQYRTNQKPHPITKKVNKKNSTEKIELEKKLLELDKFIEEIQTQLSETK